jgi:hypothetical protein
MLKSNKRSAHHSQSLMVSKTIAASEMCKKSNKQSAHPQMCKRSIKRSAHPLMCKKSKGGLLGTAVIFFVLIFGLVSFVMVKATLEHLKVSVKTEFRITLESDDRGTELLSLLKTGNTLERLGYSEAVNYTDYVDFSGLENLINRMDADGKKKLVFGNLIIGNSTSIESIKADVPIPGGKTKEVELFI